MKLVGRYDSPYVRRVGVSLRTAELPYEHLPLSVFSDATELRKLAAIGRVPVLILDDGEALIESAAILDYIDEIAGPGRALIPHAGLERRKALRIIASATAAFDKAIAISYERRRPAENTSADWLSRCRVQLDAAPSELEAFRLELPRDNPLRQTEISAACAYAYVRRVEPDAISRWSLSRFGSLECSLRGSRAIRRMPLLTQRTAPRSGKSVSKRHLALPAPDETGVVCSGRSVGFHVRDAAQTVEGAS